MQSPNRDFIHVRSERATATTATFMSKVYLWMVAGIFISGLTAFYVAATPTLITAMIQNKGMFIGLLIAQFAAVIALSAAVQYMSVLVAAAVYIFYAVLVGATFSTLFLVYSMASLSLAFFTTSFAFVGLSAIGFLTKRDLGPVGSFCTIGLFGAIGLIIVGFFVPSMMTNAMQLTISAMCIIIFAGLTAYDTQKIKALQYQFANDDDASKGAIHGALILYLDFINLFLNILRFMGNRR